MYTEEDSTFTHNGHVYCLNTVIAAAQVQPVEHVPVSDLAWVLVYTDIDEERIKRADTSIPVLVHEVVVIDGAHRLAKAIRSGTYTISARRVADAMLQAALLA